MQNLTFHPNSGDAAWVSFLKLKPTVIKPPIFVIFEEIGSLVPTPGHGGVHIMRETLNVKLKDKLNQRNVFHIYINIFTEAGV